MKWSVGFIQFVLSLGGFAIGTVEFAAMSLLPQFTDDLRVSIPEGGQAITAYALGVVVGAPILAILGARFERRALLAALMGVYAVANLASALAPTFGTLVLSRFISGLPHGAYFGVATMVSASLVPQNRRASAVARIMLGLTVATIVGVPLANAGGQAVGWRWAFVLVASIAAITAVSVLFVVPRAYVAADAGWRSEMAALRNKHVWITLAIGAIGQGGFFSMYTYLASTLTLQAGAPASMVPVALVICGVGVTLGTLITGYLCDRLPAMVMIGAALVWSAVTMALYALSVNHVGSILAAIFLIGCNSLFNPIQVRLMDVAGKAQTMAAALNHAAFNVANAIGPAAGGAVIAAGFGWSSTGWVGVGCSFTGLLMWSFARALMR